MNQSISFRKPGRQHRDRLPQGRKLVWASVAALAGSLVKANLKRLKGLAFTLVTEASFVHNGGTR